MNFEKCDAIVFGLHARQQALTTKFDDQKNDHREETAMEISDLMDLYSDLLNEKQEEKNA